MSQHAVVTHSGGSSQQNGTTNSETAGSYYSYANGYYDFIGEEGKASSAVADEDLGFDW